jgi:thiamine biosynthesis protein ThiS
MKSERTTIVANGLRQEVKLPCSISDFLGSCGWKSTQVVVERNGKIIERRELGQVMLEDGDRLEIIVPVAGG